MTFQMASLATNVILKNRIFWITFPLPKLKYPVAGMLIWKIIMYQKRDLKTGLSEQVKILIQIQSSTKISKILVEVVRNFTTDNPFMGVVFGRKQNLAFYVKNVQVVESSLPLISE